MLVAATATAGVADEVRTSPAIEQFSYSKAPMPPQYQSHCDTVEGHYVCADRCGKDY
jgi:hypothetical protein